VKALILVRHASAGKRGEWSDDDRLRPLDERGRRQAEGLAAALAEYDVERILSSPYPRCVQTVEPLASARQVELEQRTELAEGASPEDALSLVSELEGTTAVLCTHGDVIEALLGEEMKKGEIRLVVPEPGGLSATGAIPPPG
jgi:phosphohistidine phosphatase SixA